MKRELAVVSVVALVVSCSPAAPSARSPIDLQAPAAGGTPASAGDGAAVIACTHDAKDLGPCTAECDRGMAFACTIVAMRIERGEGVPKDLTRAVVLHERACELKDAPSCVSAARMHASGSGVPPSRAKQIELLGAACKLGDGLACAVPAKAFANGAGVVRDERRARDLWQLACAAGVATACEELEQTQH